MVENHQIGAQLLHLEGDLLSFAGTNKIFGLGNISTTGNDSKLIGPR